MKQYYNHAGQEGEKFMLVADMLKEKKEEKTIAVIYNDVEYTYQRLYKEVLEVTKYLTSLPCNNVGIFIENSIDYVVSYFSIAFCEKVIIPIETTIMQRQLLSVVSYCELNFIITNDTNEKKICQMLEECAPHDIVIFNVDSKKKTDILGNGELNIKIETMSGGEDNVAIMLHTSGTTSDPKKVMLTHKNLLSNIRSNIESLGLNKEDRCLIVLPMCFGYCNTSQFLSHIFLGGSIVIYDGVFFPNKFYDFVKRYHCTNTTCIPSMLYLMAASVPPKGVSSLRYLCFGGGTIASDIVIKMMENLPETGIVQTYGQTEASPRITALLPHDAKRKIGSVGKAIPGVSVKVVGNRGEELLPNREGEIVVKGNNVMKGYYKRPEETSKTIVDGWLHTGDIGMVDEEGYLYVVGRLKNMLISGGLNIYPEEIEEILRTFSGITEAVVVSRKHEVLGEVPIAKVVLKDGISIDFKEVLEYCKKNLEPHKIPREIVAVDKIEKTYNGKVRRLDK